MKYSCSVVSATLAALALASPPIGLDAMPIPPSFTQGNGLVMPRVFVDPTIPIRARVGTLFVIALRANHTTGFEWSLVTPPNASTAYVGITFEGSTGALMGSGGQELWIFKASHVGSTNLTFRYTRPFDPKTQANARQTTFNVQVTPA